MSSIDWYSNKYRNVVVPSMYVCTAHFDHIDRFSVHREGNLLPIVHNTFRSASVIRGEFKHVVLSASDGCSIWRTPPGFAASQHPLYVRCIRPPD